MLGFDRCSDAPASRLPTVALQQIHSYRYLAVAFLTLMEPVNIFLSRAAVAFGSCRKVTHNKGSLLLHVLVRLRLGGDTGDVPAEGKHSLPSKGIFLTRMYGSWRDSPCDPIPGVD